jgi:hypothetical protein
VKVRDSELQALGKGRLDMNYFFGSYAVKKTLVAISTQVTEENPLRRSMAG